MKQARSRVLATAGLAISALTLAALPAAAQKPLTAQQVLQRCQDAYAALGSYSGRTDVQTQDDINGRKASYHTMADVQWARPNHIRVTGTLLTGGTFAFVSNGPQTWETTMGGSGQWQRSRSAEMSIASFTGVSQSADTTIPAILLHTTWGDPFTRLAHLKVTRAPYLGRSVYRVDGSGRLGNETLWIDPGTLLLVKFHRVLDLPRLNQGSTSALFPSSGTVDSNETFTSIRVNPQIPASTFAKPKGAK